MTARDRAALLHWSIEPGTDNPAGDAIFREIRRWNHESITGSLSSNLDLRDLHAWDARLVRDSASRANVPREANAVTDALSDEDRDTLADAFSNLDGDAFVNGYGDNYLDADRHRHALRRLAKAVFHGHPDTASDTGD